MHENIDGNKLVYTASHRVAALKYAASPGAVAHGNDQFRVGGCVVGFSQRDCHIVGYRAGDKQHIGVAR